MRWRGEELPGGCPIGDGELLVEECDAFLGGHWAHVLHVARQTVPLLAWMNVLAHGSLRDVKAMGRWSHLPFVEAMSEEVLRVVLDESTLRLLQREALIPLELELLDRDGDMPLNSRELLGYIQDAADTFGGPGRA